MLIPTVRGLDFTHITARGLNHGLGKHGLDEHRKTPLSHSLTRIWIHAVWATKARMPLLAPDIEPRVHAVLRRQFSELGCQVSAINGMPDHVHCLFMLNSRTSIADTIKQVKGFSAHEINTWGRLPCTFAWQTGYSAYSVSASALMAIRDYIAQQKRHHSPQPVV